MLFDSFKSRADFESEYFLFNSFNAVLVEFISEFVISANVLLDIGLPFKYKTASILVIKSIADNLLSLKSV